MGLSRSLMNLNQAGPYMVEPYRWAFFTCKEYKYKRKLRYTKCIYHMLYFTYDHKLYSFLFSVNEKSVCFWFSQ